ncbi:MAG: hypothetical protein GWN18_04485, partial [Thermoplasmata archaeon]|nr:hypothetical protein [Thermoplasmata archaeon]NIS11114.1 hypothetical protein [Thermoplasmata archaeon]NIW81836.1 hypothetical protein [Thermoplasmata archaeon]NIW88013.1 hypothetical protein [Thermoplasmata archaeon]
MATLLLERERFPRDKPCGGAMYATVLDRYPELEAVADRRVAAVRTHLNYEQVVTRPKDTLLFRRTRLDEHLARRAEAAGVDLRDGVNVRRIDFGPDGVTVGDGMGKEFRGSLLVDA